VGGLDRMDTMESRAVSGCSEVFLQISNSPKQDWRTAIRHVWLCGKNRAMSMPSMNPRKIVVLTGAGVSAPSGLATFRSLGGLWEQHRIEDVASRFVVAGTSLAVFPAAGLVRYAHEKAEKIVVDLDPPAVPGGFRVLKGSADGVMRGLASEWLNS